MKANELMIGDWVLVDNSQIQVKQVYQYGIVSDLGEGDEEIECFKPIPLTPEILEKNGFIIKKKWAQIGNFGNSPLIVWHFEDDTILHDFKHELEIHQNDTGKVHIKIHVSMSTNSNMH